MPGDAAILQARDEMRRAGFNDREIEEVLVESLGAAPRPEPTALGGGPTGRAGLTGTQQVGAFLGPAALGSVGSGLGARLAASPRVASVIERIASPFLRKTAEIGVRAAQPAAEFAGIAAGDVAARAVTGREQSPRESAGVGLFGAGAGSLFRAGTRVAAGYLGGVPRQAIAEAGVPTAGVVPSFQKVTRPAPTTAGQAAAGISAESRLTERIGSAVKQLHRRLTPERQQKVALLEQADAAGVRIDPAPILDEIIDALPAMRAEPTTAAFARYLERFATRFSDEVVARGGRLTPSQLDEFIHTNLAPKAFTQAGAPSLARAGPVVRQIKQTATELLNKNLPAEVRKLNARISQRLTLAEEAEARFGDQANAIANLRGLMRPGSEESAQALKFLSDTVDPLILKESRRLATQRAFTTDIREATPNVGYFGAAVRRPFEFAGQIAAPLQPFAGPAAGGAVNAFLAAMQRERQKQPAP